ncbi:uncharacterized protein LOC133856918 isoform X4 [Alnus glutinosa]|uniref:uncharacterized protein LOC133856918 isoform X4 n=1 Tax=Alnus glutinosa TaxID=3517 RepID=UPI002D778092|nr:uncharacterized protein LOC133856918 isoform X4 [Alnus glutinosa]
MPGNIQVSVLEFMGLPSSSPSSSISFKVSMGKIEFQTWDKGDFSFPLTTLRDNLIVALLDADGKEISHAGVETTSIVEKGIWDDLFLLEGGGHVHMKLQFVLSEEERDRIRMMRASALKIKHDELLNRSIRSSRTATMEGSTVTSSLGFSHEVSVSVEEITSKGCLVSSPVIFCKSEKSGTESIKGIHPDQKQLTSDQYEEVSSAIPVPQGVDVHLTEESQGELFEKNESKSLPAEFPIRSNESSLLLGGSGLDRAATSDSIPHNLEEDRAHNPQKQSQLGKTPSKVRKMISAFESGLAQDMRPSIKPPPTQSQSKELQHGPTFIRKRGEKINSLGALDGSKSSRDTGKLEESNTKKFQIKGTNSNLRDEFNVVNKEVDREEEKSHQDLMRLPTFETPTVSGRMLDEHSGRQPPCNLFPDKQDSCGNTVTVESRRGIQFKNLQEINVGGASCHKFESLECCEAKHSSFESSDAWIFPDEARRFCVTTGGKKVMILMGGSSIKPKLQEGKLNLSMQENMEEHTVDAGNVIKVDKDEKNCHKIRKLKPESSEDMDTSGGPLGQAIKVAIMVGFGILVLLTRQRNNR